MTGPWFLLKADLNAPDAQLCSLRAELPEEEPPDALAIEAALRSSLSAAVDVAVLEWTRGTFHWVARGRLADGRDVATRVLRLDRPELRDGLVVGASAAARALSEGLPAPEPLAVGVGQSGPPLVVFTWLPGIPLGRWDNDETLTVRILGEVGEALRRLHEITGTGAGPMAPDSDPERREPTGRHPDWPAFLSCRLAEHLLACRALGAIDAAEATLAARWLEDGDWQQGGVVNRMLHGDAGPANLLVDDAGRLAGLLDWEDAMVGDPVFELASCASFHPERRWPALFEGYLGQSALPAGMASRFWRYFLRVSLARTVARARFGQADLPGRAPAASRIQRALAALDRGTS